MSRSVISAAVAVAAILVSCVGEKRPQPQTFALSSAAPSDASAAQADAQIAVLKGLYGAVDPSAVNRAYAADAEEMLADGTLRRGRAAIEAALVDERRRLSGLVRGAGRVWVKGDTAIAEEAMHAVDPAHPERQVGIPSLEIYWFDRAGLIKMHHSYSVRGILEAQLAGEADAPPPPTMPARLEIHVARDTSDEAALAVWAGRFDSAWQDGLPAVMGFFGDDTAVDCNLGSHVKGKREVDTALRKWLAPFPDQRWTVDHVWSIENYIVVEHTMRATHKGKFGGKEATGKAIAWPWAEVYRIEGGKLAHDWAYTDFAAFTKQVEGS
jgi:predicted ester cyclase